MSKSDKIVHICNLDKFIPPFIDFLEEHFDDFEERHVFWVRGDSEKYPYRPRKNIISAPIGRLRSMLSYIRAVNSADKIILHGLFNANQIRLLSVMPWLHKKCYWVIWGGDLYRRQLAKRTFKWRINEVLRRWIISRIGHLVTHIGGDVDLARKWYGAKGHWHECFMYTSNLFHKYEGSPKADPTINILVGNSADPSNNHEEILERLTQYKNDDIQIYAPLSYGNPAHAEKIAKLGNKLFGDKFTAVTQFMAFNEYMEFLSTIDIAIFNHNRQQAMGNTTTLLGMGKSVYMRSGLSSSQLMRDLGVSVQDVATFKMERISSEIAEINAMIISQYFSHENLASSWRRIFE